MDSYGVDVYDLETLKKNYEAFKEHFKNSEMLSLDTKENIFKTSQGDYKIPLIRYVSDVKQNIKMLRTKTLARYYMLYNDLIVSDKRDMKDMKEYDDQVRLLKQLDENIKVIDKYEQWINTNTNSEAESIPFIVFECCQRHSRQTVPKTIETKKISKVTKGKESKINTISTIQEKTIEKFEKRFRFKTKEECISKKTSAVYYMSKNELVDVLDKNPDLVSRFNIPKYKSMNKADICTAIFSSK